MQTFVGDELQAWRGVGGLKEVEVATKVCC